jgi:small subunit ribosomal protein S21
VRGCSRRGRVKIQEGESIESALRRFKRKVQQEDIIKDIKKHSFYLKPGDKRASQAGVWRESGTVRSSDANRSSARGRTE